MNFTENSSFLDSHAPTCYLLIRSLKKNSSATGIFSVPAAFLTFCRISYFTAPRLRFHHKETFCVTRTLTSSQRDGAPHGWAPVSCWPAVQRCTSVPGCSAAPLLRSLPSQRCAAAGLPASSPAKGDGRSEGPCAVSGRNRWAPCGSTVFQGGERAPAGGVCPVRQRSRLSGAAFPSHHLPPFTPQHSQNRQSPALPWKPPSR